MFSRFQLFCAGIPQRWVFAVMGFLAVTNAYTMRICLSLAITEMVSTSATSANDTSLDDTCPDLDSSTSSNSSSSSGTFEWSEYTQGIILSSFFWGYIITQLPGGVLADKFGGKYTLGLGIFSTAVFTLLTPVVVETFDATGLIVLRFLMGLGEGTTFPAVNVLIAQWAPPHERSKIGTVVMTGAQVGTVLGTALSGILIRYSSLGWPTVFYVFGGFGVLWFFVWLFLCYSTPATHPFITDREKHYLHETMNEHTHKRGGPTPWARILRSGPLWALVAGKVGHDWGFYTMVTDLPLYMSNVLKFSIQANGFLSALPYVVMWIASIASSWLADWLIKREKIGITNVRKICTTIASVGPAIFIIAASYAGCDRTVVVVLFTLGMGLMGPFYPGMMVNAIDLSPNYSGTLMAIVNGIGAIAGILAPYAVGVLTPNQTVGEWRVVFWITFVVFFVSNLVFDIWADGEVQPWNDPTEEIERQARKEIESKNEQGVANYGQTRNNGDVVT
ncbi:putative inorganic phosphate cotransporter isoform X2 [Neodiprion fabricii]|uniref:putative inorganic phosphate cotransporter isoform X2 n=1 Tax=Neodiprion fabricii TaxID=2872261 RepID=UPI001ED95594|nr:putative inorganic phosphate cotransporter isoform X2 [Neodiprion fabricii]